MSDGTKILLTILLLIGGISLFVAMQNKCEAKGGRLMKTLYNTYECVQLKEGK